MTLSEQDRGLVKIMCDAAPWSGGEEGMLARLALEDALRIDDLASHGPSFPIDKLSTDATEYSLTEPQIDLLVSILCGAGGSPASHIGRPCARLVARIRAAPELAGT